MSRGASFYRQEHAWGLLVGRPAWGLLGWPEMLNNVMFCSLDAEKLYFAACLGPGARLGRAGPARNVEKRCLGPGAGLGPAGPARNVEKQRILRRLGACLAGPEGFAACLGPGAGLGSAWPA